MRRIATIHRKTNETDIRLKLNLDGQGKSRIATGIRFFDHMLDLVARHGAFDLEITAKGDLDVDQHHTVEDVGIALGEAVLKALGSKRGILRAGYFLMPMDETLAAAAVDLGGRPYCVVNAKIAAKRSAISKRSSPKIFSRDSRKPREPTFICARCTAARLIIKSKRCSKLLRARCVSPSRAIDVFAVFFPARRGFYEGHAHRLRCGQRHERRARSAASRRREPTLQFAGVHCKSRSALLPGVGHYAAIIRALDERNLRAPLLDAIQRGVPFLGVCLGLQALYDTSEEAPELCGLNLFSGSVRSLPTTVKLPHMGWNQLKLTRASRLLEGISAEAYFYFAHTFAATDARWRSRRSLQPRRRFRRRHRKTKYFRRAIPPGKKRRRRRATSAELS